MKHIKKKFAFCEKKIPVKEKTSISTLDRRDNDGLKTVDENKKIAFMEDTEGYHILSLLYNNQGKELLLPIPDLTLAYYDSAYMNNYQREKFKNDLFEKLSQTSDITDSVSHEIYRYINYSTTSLIMMFTSIESFLNSLIPENQSYKKKKKTYNKKEIERYIGFEEKILQVIPKFEHKSFYTNNNDFKKSPIGKLKYLRDEIIHTKSSLLFQSQSKLIKQLLDFDFDNSLIETKEFMNFYRSNYIENCSCNQDF